MKSPAAIKTALKNSLLPVYRKIPGIRELLQIRDGLRQGVAAQRAIGAIRLEFEAERHPRYGDPKRLFRYAAEVCSQNGEDGVISEIFNRIGTGGRVFAEVGVGEGIENNTAFLLSQGWTGFWIDGADSFLQTLERRPDLRGAVKSMVAYVSLENIAGLFARLGVPSEFDLLSLDIDQNTYYAWKGLAQYRPRVVVVEYNATIPPSVDWKVRYAADRAWDGSNNFGASLKAFENLGRQSGYSLVGCDFFGNNAFFVRNDLTDDKFLAPYTAENHYEPPRYALDHRRGHPAAILDRDG